MADLEIHERIVFCHILDIRENLEKKKTEQNTAIEKENITFSDEEDHFLDEKNKIININKQKIINIDIETNNEFKNNS